MFKVANYKKKQKKKQNKTKTKQKMHIGICKKNGCGSLS